MLKNNLSFFNKDCDIENNFTHLNVPCSLACYSKIMLRLVYLNKVSRMDKFEIVVISYKNQLSGLKDSPDPVGRLMFDVRPDKVDRSSGSVKNNCRSVQTPTTQVDKAPSCLDCPTPSRSKSDPSGEM